MPRDNFSKTVTEALAKRAAYLCCNPECEDPFTSLPHSDKSRAINVGVASHICAASPGGPRYDENQTPAERASINNGIWLCQRCAPEVDRDVMRFTRPLLHAWKQEHETVLASAPLRRALFGNGSRARSANEVAVARKLLSFLGDRRMLFENFAWEVPNEVFESLQATRQNLATLNSETVEDSPLHKAITHLQETCYTFLRHAGDLSSRQKISEMPQWEQSQRFRFSLSALRKSFGVQLADVARAYGLQIPQRLKHICPQDMAVLAA